MCTQHLLKYILMDLSRLLLVNDVPFEVEVEVDFNWIGINI